MRARPQILDHAGKPMRASGYAGTGSGFGNQLGRWNPAAKSMDAALLPGLSRGNARADDLVRNHGLAQGGVQLHIDNMVGHLFRLSAKPRWERLGISADDGRSIGADIESLWMELVEDPTGAWLDAERKRTFTMIMREAAGNHCTSGEVTSVAEWIEDRPDHVLKTAIKTISTHRISNPNGIDSSNIRGGVKSDRHGCAISYFVQEAANTPYGIGNGLSGTWKEIPRETSWGRQQFLHVFEPSQDGQTRGANKFLSVLEQCHMLSKLQNTKLQNAVVNAMYAATIETDLGSEAAMQIIGGEDGADHLFDYMEKMSDFHGAANIKIDGVQIPHLVPGERLNLLTSSNADNGFSELEASIIRYIAAGLGVSYEQLARDYSKTNYSSARASIMESWRYFMGRRKVIVGRYASMIYALVLEEMIDRKWLVLPKKARNFYEAKASWTNCEWIGTGRIAIDGLKEVKEAVLRIESGLSTYEKEAALMGEDYRELFAQQVREIAERKEAGLPLASWVATQQLAPDQPDPEEQSAPAAQAA